MNNQLRSTAIADTFADVSDLIHKMAWKFSRQYALPFEEVHSEAVLRFMIAYNEFDRNWGKGASFSSFLYFCLHCNLTDFCKREFRHTHLAVRFLDESEEDTAEDMLERLHYHENGWRRGRLDEIADEVSEWWGQWGRQFLDIVFNEPEGLRIMLASEGTKTPHRYKRVLQEFLMDMDWPKEFVSDIFKALSIILREIR